MGGIDPHGSLSRPKGRKWGRSRPTPCFGPVAFLPRVLRISLFLLGFGGFPGDAQTERPAERFPLHPVPSDSSSLARKSGCFGTTHVSKYTFRFGAFDGNSTRSSASAMLPAFQLLKSVSKRSPANLRFASLKNSRSVLLTVLNSELFQMLRARKYRIRSPAMSDSSGILTAELKSSVTFSKCARVLET